MVKQSQQQAQGGLGLYGQAFRISQLEENYTNTTEAKKQSKTTSTQAGSGGSQLPWRLRQEDCHKFEASHNYTVKPCLKKQKQLNIPLPKPGSET